MFYWDAPVQDGQGAVVGQCGFTSRDLGLGSGRYAGFNLAGHVGDDPVQVAANRAQLAAQLGVGPHRLVVMDQVHGAEVAVVSGPCGPTGAGQADAVVTATPGLALVVLVADCVPVLLFDPDTGVYGVAHAGRAGLVAGVVPAAVESARALGATGLRAVVGPSICPRCYEVPADLRERAAQASPAAWSVSWTGTPAVDVAGGVVDQLAALRVPTRWVAGCTREDERLYSHRATRPTGRFAGVVRLGQAPAADRPVTDRAVAHRSTPGER